MGKGMTLLATGKWDKGAKQFRMAIDMATAAKQNRTQKPELRVGDRRIKPQVRRI